MSYFCVYIVSAESSTCISDAELRSEYDTGSSYRIISIMVAITILIMAKGSSAEGTKRNQLAQTSR